MNLINHVRARQEVDHMDCVERLKARLGQLTDQRMKEWFAMKGGLQAIANAEQDVRVEHLQQIAQAILDYLGRCDVHPAAAEKRRCAVCFAETTAAGKVALCSPECRRAYNAWSAVITPEGGA